MIDGSRKTFPLLTINICAPVRCCPGSEPGACATCGDLIWHHGSAAPDGRFCVPCGGAFILRHGPGDEIQVFSPPGTRLAVDSWLGRHRSPALS